MGLADGQLHREDGAVLASAVDLADGADDRRGAGPEVARQASVVLGLAGVGEEHLEVVADDLVGGVAEDPLGGRVHRLDDAGVVEGDDAVNGRIDDRLEADGGLMDGLLGVAALGHVAPTLVKPQTFPSASRIGLMTPLAKNRLPSLRRCQRSSLA